MRPLRPLDDCSPGSKLLPARFNVWVYLWKRAWQIMLHFILISDVYSVLQKVWRFYVPRPNCEVFKQSFLYNYGSSVLDSTGRSLQNNVYSATDRLLQNNVYSATDRLLQK